MPTCHLGGDRTLHSITHRSDGSACVGHIHVCVQIEIPKQTHETNLGVRFSDVSMLILSEQQLYTLCLKKSSHL